MKEMVGNYVDGQIEFYKAVRNFPPCISVDPRSAAVRSL